MKSASFPSINPNHIIILLAVLLLSLTFNFWHQTEVDSELPRPFLAPKSLNDSSVIFDVIAINNWNR